MGMLAPEAAESMSLIRFDSADAYLAAAAPLIAHDVSRSVGLRAWIEGRKRASATERAFMAIWRSNDAVGVGYQRGDQPVVVGDSAARACCAFADSLADEYPKLDGVIGKLGACEAFADRWQVRTGRTHALRFHMRNHVLHELIAPPAVPGSIRVAGQGDRDWLIEMHHAFAVETGVPIATDSAPRLVDERLAEGRFRIWTDGEDVAFAGFTIAGPEAARVGPVYTLPAYRANGYAAAIVGTICAELTRSGRKVFLVTDIANPTSNALYLRLGFVSLADSHWFDLVDAG
jgi:uncharacterized protein